VVNLAFIASRSVGIGVEAGTPAAHPTSTTSPASNHRFDIIPSLDDDKVARVAW
jgi:hypothetical protein